MPRIHIINQFIWPDGAPTAIYAEQLAARLSQHHNDVVLVGGGGVYRSATRPPPAVAMVRFTHRDGRRGHIASVMREYQSVLVEIDQYIGSSVANGDVVVMSSAPPNTIWSHRGIHRRGARALYWLQDYYPELIRGLFEYPRLGRMLFAKMWDAELAKWDKVVKVAGNLGYHGANAVVIRNWPTMEFDSIVEPVRRTALYSGNLGYGHHVPSLVQACVELRERGFQVTVQGDGPGMARLPRWVERRPPVDGVDELRASYLGAEVHLVAGHPRIRTAVFPSKVWNTIASGRAMIGTGFEGELAHELEVSREAQYSSHLDRWTSLVSQYVRT